jgi:PBP4 family serine-type D-alanyl-D-alanine carboxypeptidase
MTWRGALAGAGLVVLGIVPATWGANAKGERGRDGATHVSSQSTHGAPGRGASNRSRETPEHGAAKPARRDAENAASKGSAHGAVGKAKTSGDTTPRVADEVPAPAPDDRDRERITRMQETIGEILHNRTLGRLHVGLRVMSARTGRLFYGRRGEALMDPASNQKVLATTAALLRLGGDWRYRTEISGLEPDDDGVVHGSLYLRGNGDPTLRSMDLERVATHLRAQGVTRIDGGVVADARLLGWDTPPSDEEPGDTKAPLVVDRGMTVIRVRPGGAPGAPPVVLTEQRRFAEDAGQSLGFVVHNQATTRANGRTRIAVRVETAEGRMRIAVSGRIAVGAAGVSFRRRVPRPALHTAIVLRAALGAAGIVVHDGASAGVTPNNVSVLDVHESEPLTIVLRRINKDSDNEQAERVLQTVGVEVLGAPASTEKGVTVLRAVIGSLGLRPNSYVPRNGSGLGHANRITANAMAELLRALYFDPRIGPDLLQSLSVGGVDGTTRNRFKGTLASRRVRAKTGTLDGKSCLSGLVGDGDDVVVFSMMVQGFHGKGLAAVRASQVGAVNAIMRYVREGTGERIELPPGFDEQVAGTDVETAGEESGSEGEAESPDDVKRAPGEDAVDAYLRQARAGAGGAGGAAPAIAGGGGANGTAPRPTQPPSVGAPRQPPPFRDVGGTNGAPVPVAVPRPVAAPRPIPPQGAAGAPAPLSLPAHR